MVITNPDLLNSCLVCRSPNQDGEYECLYTNSHSTNGKPELSEAGILYENLLNISLNMCNYYPQYLCNSCDLQMKLFKKLKDKAYKTLEYLQSLHANVYQTGKDFAEAEHIEALQELETKEFLHKKTINESKVFDSELEEEQIFGESILNETIENDIECKEELFSCKKENHVEICAIRRNEQLDINSFYINGEQYVKQEDSETQNLLDTEECTNNGLQEIQLLELAEDEANAVDKMSEIELELDTNSAIDKNDYVTEIYVTNETFDENTEVLEDYDAYEETNTETSSVFNDVEYILEEFSETSQDQEELKDLNLTKKRKIYDSRRKAIKVNNTTKKEYKCGACELIFKNTQEYKEHRKEWHNELYPCFFCSKELKSLAGLHTHMKLHNDQPAYQCEICQKTFSQKYHFQYHMNRHNNVRNFKCSECEKNFLSKSDLKIHMRTHTGHRPYVCNICGKDYLMMEHLKAHALIHSQEYFQCDICLHKFATHKTLRTHRKTIHEDEPRFKCSYCTKAFRRKHHLEYHLRLHQKNEKFVDNGFELLDPDNPDDCEPIIDYTTEDLLDQELVDDPGFIAL